MPLLLPLTDTAIADYQNHLREFPGTDPVILAYLTRHINGLMCGEIEQVVTQLIVDRLAIGHRDSGTLDFFPNFLKSRRISSVRNASFEEIRNTLSSFGPAYREKFNGLVHDAVDNEGIEKLRAAVVKRNEDAHSIPPSITFQEVEETYSVAVAVIDAVSTTLKT